MMMNENQLWFQIDQKCKLNDFKVFRGSVMFSKNLLVISNSHHLCCPGGQELLRIMFTNHKSNRIKSKQIKFKDNSLFIPQMEYYTVKMLRLFGRLNILLLKLKRCHIKYSYSDRRDGFSPKWRLVTLFFNEMNFFEYIYTVLHMPHTFTLIRFFLILCATWLSFFKDLIWKFACLHKRVSLMFEWYIRKLPLSCHLIFCFFLSSLISPTQTDSWDWRIDIITLL